MVDTLYWCHICRKVMDSSSCPKKKHKHSHDEINEFLVNMALDQHPPEPERPVDVFDAALAALYVERISIHHEVCASNCTCVRDATIEQDAFKNRYIAAVAGIPVERS